MFFLKLCTNDYITTTYPVQGHVSCHLKLYVVRVGLVRPLQPWDILLIYCNNQLKKYIALLLRLERGALSTLLLMSMLEAFSVFFHRNKTSVTQELWVIKPVPDPEAKLSSSEIMNPTSITVSYNNYVMIWWSMLSCIQLCDPMDCSLPGSPAHGISQARKTGVGCHFLLQGISSSQGPKTHLLCLYTSLVSICGEGSVTHSSILARRNLMDRGTWKAIVHGVAKSQTWLSD